MDYPRIAVSWYHRYRKPCFVSWGTMRFPSLLYTNKLLDSAFFLYRKLTRCHMTCFCFHCAGQKVEPRPYRFLQVVWLLPGDLVPPPALTVSSWWKRFSNKRCTCHLFMLTLWRRGRVSTERREQRWQNFQRGRTEPSDWLDLQLEGCDGVSLERSLHMNLCFRGVAADGRSVAGYLSRL